VQQSHQPAGVADGLLKPKDALTVTLAGVLGQSGVLGQAVGLISGRDGEDEKQGEGRPRDESQELWVLERVDVVHLQRVAET
jgi:hypothetical protein